MIKTEELKRNNTLLLNDHVVKVMSISKGSIRVFDVTDNQYVQYWFGIEQFKGKPILFTDLEGFHISKETQRFVRHVNDDIDIELTQTETGWSVFINDMFLIQIRFLHQLEMIIFALIY